MSNPITSKPAPVVTISRDPRVLEILAAFDRVALSPEGDQSTFFMQHVCGFDSQWPAHRARMLLVAFLDACMTGEVSLSSEIDEALEAARGEVEWVKEFEHQQVYERTTGGCCYSPAFVAWRESVRA